MNPNKTPGPDGLNPCFFQTFWDIFGSSISSDCRSWLTHFTIPESVRDTNIVLLPKKQNPSSMSDLRPISLCDVRYRLVSKVLANRLRQVIPHIIGEEQSAFVQGRSIVDNVLIAAETLHTMNTRRYAKFGEVAVKVDISKAFDRVEWDYLKMILQKMGFADQWVRWMIMCVTSARYSVLVNSKKVGPVLPERGLRQGCPLSPFLFILCAEGLSFLLRRAISDGALHGVQVCQRAPRISHLFFADDSFFFCRAQIDEVRTLKNIFNTYAAASGQIINYEKSGIYDSKSTHPMLASGIGAILGINTAFGGDHYLGMPSLIGRNRKVAFRFMKERVWQRLQTWRGRKVSNGGREVLIKAVAQAIPTYCMSVYFLPNLLTAELERMMNSFWWGTNGRGGGGINWMAWERICVRKEAGGMGFRDLRNFNLAMLGKQGWKFLTQPDALVTRIFKARYFPRGDFLSAPKGNGPSYVWQSIRRSQTVVHRGSRWRVGNGSNIRVWDDQWLRQDGNLSLITDRDDTLEGLKVCDLFIPGVLEWDCEMIEALFEPRDALAILNIPLGVGGESDTLIWHYEANGGYSVRSAYRVLMENIFPRPEYMVQGAWSQIWSLNTPPRIKNFMWRLARSVIPTREALRRRHIAVPSACGICGNDIEDYNHLFFDCPFAEDCWDHASLFTWIGAIKLNTPLFTDRLQRLLLNTATDSRDKACSVLWGLWRERNRRVWTSEACTARTATKLALEDVANWLAAQTIIPNVIRPTPPSCGKWHAPPHGTLKCNSDFGFSASTNEMGMGIVLRDSSGQVLGFKQWHGVGQWTPREGEAAALLSAMRWIVGDGHTNVIFECDAEQVTNAINHAGEDHSEFGCLISQCRVILLANPNFKVQVVRRNRNQVAHMLARQSFSLDTAVTSYSPPVGMDSVLYEICFDSNH
ncbi:Putative ribonuclease H protein At1g65750 [Linum perenne]